MFWVWRLGFFFLAALFEVLQVAASYVAVWVDHLKSKRGLSVLSAKKKKGVQFRAGITFSLGSLAESVSSVRLNVGLY